MSEDEKQTKVLRGFASMAPEKLREIARLGGIAAHESGRAHRFTSEEARVAGRKGGLASARNLTPEERIERGRRGGTRAAQAEEMAAERRRRLDR